jgi:hypothetical protein
MLRWGKTSLPSFDASIVVCICTLNYVGCNFRPFINGKVEVRKELAHPHTFGNPTNFINVGKFCVCAYLIDLPLLNWLSWAISLDSNWSPANFPQFHAILSSFAGYTQRILWALFLAQSWALWTTRNKLTIERKVINHPTNIIYKTVIFLQLWRPKFKGMERKGLNWMERELRELYASMKPRSWRNDGLTRAKVDPTSFFPVSPGRVLKNR